MEKVTNTLFLSLGGNLGDRKLNILNAYHEIEIKIGIIKKKSSFYETPPFEFEATSNFLNTVIIVETKLSPEEVLSKTQEIERNLGRTSKTNGFYSSRLIDIDILFYNELVTRSEQLNIPHLKYLERNFVIAPLLELEPQKKDPLSLGFIKNTHTSILTEPNISVLKP